MLHPGTCLTNVYVELNVFTMAVEIKEMTTSNPTEFWKNIQGLGPRKNKSIPIEVVDESGNTSQDENIVFERWKNDFYNLYNCNDRNDFDEVHYDRAKLHKVLIENNMSDPLYAPNVLLNSNVTIEED